MHHLESLCAVAARVRVPLLVDAEQSHRQPAYVQSTTVVGSVLLSFLRYAIQSIRVPNPFGMALRHCCWVCRTLLGPSCVACCILYHSIVL